MEKEIKNLSNLEKEYLAELERILYKKEKYRHHDRDDPDYYGSLFSNVYLDKFI